MEKFYEYACTIWRLEEDGRLVNVFDQRWYTPEQVDTIINRSTEIDDVRAFSESLAENLRSRIQTINSYLPYADGPARFQDIERIQECERELDLIEKYISDNF